MEKFILKSLLINVVLLLSMNMLADNICINGIYYNLNASTKTASVTSAEQVDTLSIPVAISYNDTQYKVTNIDAYAFYNFTAKKIIIPNSVIEIGNAAFYNCNKLKELNLPNSIKKVGYNVYCYLKSLERVNIICDNLDDFTNYLKRDDVYDIFWRDNMAGTMSCDHYIFINGELLENCEIPENITELKSSYALYKNMGLVSLKTGSLNELKKDCLGCCANLRFVELDEKLTSIDEYAFLNCTRLELIAIPKNIKYIGWSAFYGCNNVKHINYNAKNATVATWKYGSGYYSVFPDSVCEVKIGSDVETIGGHLFCKLSKIKTIDIPESVKSIGEGSFSNCSNLTKINIGKGVSSISNSAFANCSNLDSVFCNPETVPNANDDIFENSNIENATLFIPNVAMENYKNTLPWKSFKTIKSIEDATAIKNISVNSTKMLTRKFINDGKVVIEKNGKIYSSNGSLLSD